MLGKACRASTTPGARMLRTLRTKVVLFLQSFREVHSNWVPAGHGRVSSGHAPSTLVQYPRQIPMVKYKIEA